ncbi:hypothetical protein PHMEG_00024286, partial [Phytophthora megakarya]
SSTATSAPVGASSAFQPLQIRAIFLSSHGVLKTLSHELRSKIHCAAHRSSPLACCASPLRKEWDVTLLVAPAGFATRFKKRLTSPAFSDVVVGAASNGSWLTSDIHGASCITRATAKACIGQTRKSSRPGTRVRPCSSVVFTGSIRT